MQRSVSEIAFERKTMKEFDKIPKSFWFPKLEHPSIRGIPDRLGVINGRFVALEFKKDANELKKITGRTKLQHHMLLRIRKAGGYSSFIFPENKDIILEDLRRIANGI